MYIKLDMILYQARLSNVMNVYNKVSLSPIQIFSLYSKESCDFTHRTPCNNNSKMRLVKLWFEYVKKGNLECFEELDMKLLFCKLRKTASSYRAIGSFFMMMSKNVEHHGWPMIKNFKITLAKTP